MNEINEIFTKRINGFEYSIKNWFEKEKDKDGCDSFSHRTIYKILKNKKWVKVEFFGEMNYRPYSDNSAHIWKVKNSSSWNYSEDFTEKLFTSKGNNIWQMLQDEWHKRFCNER